jgi:pimeloyl-ACP methyl ester carboxylesterase
MQRRIGNVAIESIAAESPKFTAPMVLIHGLWCTAAVWRKCMGYFAHRGWICHALTLRGRADTGSRIAIGQVRFADYLQDVHQVVAACEAPPVVVGHDIGGLLALYRSTPAARAVVAIAPLVPPSIAANANPALSRLAARIATLRARPLPPPHGKMGAEYFARGVPGGTTPDSSCVARELHGSALSAPARTDVPTLVVAGERDPFCPPSDVERLARHVGATFRIAEGAGHAMPWEAGWEQRVSEIHRWLIQTLGEPLLAVRDEEE